MICCTASTSIAFHACRPTTTSCDRLTVQLDPAVDAWDDLARDPTPPRARRARPHRGRRLAGGTWAAAIRSPKASATSWVDPATRPDRVRPAWRRHLPPLPATPSKSQRRIVRGRRGLRLFARRSAKRRFYLSTDSVEDSRSDPGQRLRKARSLRRPPISTKVAEMYAKRTRTRRSPDPRLRRNSDDAEPLALSTFAAVPGVLKRLYSFLSAPASPAPGRRAPLPRHPHRRQRLHGEVVSGDGRAHSMSISSDDLLGLLLEEPRPPDALQIPRGSTSALHGDAAPIARLLSRGEGEKPGPAAINIPLYYATTCKSRPSPGAGPHPRATACQARRKSTPCDPFPLPLHPAQRA